MENVVDLIIPFIALAILSVMIDKLTLVLEAIMNKIPKLPDRIEWFLAYIIVLCIAFLVCWQGSFNLFVYLGIYFAYDWQGWLMTALVISGGSAFVRTNFTMIESIPNAIRGLSATVRSVFEKPKMNNHTDTEYQKVDSQLNKNNDNTPTI